MIISKLALKQLSGNKKRTLITLFGIIVSVSMITAIAGMAESTRDFMRQIYMEASGNWHGLFNNVTVGDVERLTQEPLVENVYTQETDTGLEVRFRLKNPGSDYANVINGIYTSNNITSGSTIRLHHELLAAEGIIADTFIITIYSFCGILIVIVVVGSILVIANAFSISANERIRQFGLLKSIGATKEQIRRAVIIEGLITAVAAIPLGVLTGFIVEIVALGIANNLLHEAIMLTPGSTEVKLRIVFSLPAVLFSASISLITIIISAWIPARKASGISAIDAVRLANEIKISQKKIKTSKYVKAVFGFEGMLADKALKRSKGKYRATVASLVTSMVLFMSGYSFGENIGKAGEMVYVDAGINAYIVLLAKRTEMFDAVVDKLRNIEEAETWLAYEVTHPSQGISQFLNEEMRKAAEINTIRLHALPDLNYNQLCTDLGIRADNTVADSGILINTASIRAANRLAELKPLDYTKNMNVRFGLEDEYSVTLIGETKDVPKDIITGFGNRAVNIVISEKDLSNYYKDERIAATVSASAQNPEEFCEKADEIIDQLNDNEAGYALQNIEREARLNHNLSMLITVFIMGFVGLLSLIAVTSVIGTVSTNIALRRREFAMLQSVGMTRKELRMMLNYESILYGMKSIMVGIPLGTLVSWLLYTAMSESLSYGFIFPYKSALICVAAVLSLTFFTMRYSVKKLDKSGIVEELKMEAI